MNVAEHEAPVSLIAKVLHRRLLWRKPRELPKRSIEWGKKLAIKPSEWGKSSKGLPRAEAAGRSYSEVNKGFQALASEMTNYSKKAFDDAMRTWEQLIGVKSLE